MFTAVVGWPFQATIVGAPEGETDTITVDVYDPTDGTVLLAPTTANIVEPRPGTYTSSLVIDSAGTYAVRWIDGSFEMEEQLLVIDVKPTLARLASIMKARTEGLLARQGEFNSETTPTDTDAQDLIDLATELVLGKARAISASIASTIRNAILFKAAMLVEASYRAEEANGDDSTFALWQTQYDELIAVLEGYRKGRVTSIRLHDPDRADLGGPRYVVPELRFWLPWTTSP